MCEGSFLPSSFGPHQKHTEFDSSLRSYPLNLSFFERWDSASLCCLDLWILRMRAKCCMSVGTGKMRRKPARRCMSLGSHLCKKQKRTPALVDRKRHTVGSLARRVAAAAIGTAWGAAARVAHRDLRR